MGTMIERRGSELFILVDGTRLLMYKAGPGVWVNHLASALKVRKVGNQMLIYTGETILTAIKATANTWLVGDDGPGPGPDPSPSGFSWPYEPTWLHWVTSEFGPRSGRFHEGMDFSGGPASYGSPIPAINAGTVSHKNNISGAFGNHVAIFHGLHGGRDIYSLYAHMVNPTPLSIGNAVTKGQTIGLVNNTGSSFGSHLHMETHVCMPGQPMRFDNLNPSYSSPRTSINPRSFFAALGDGTWILS